MSRLRRCLSGSAVSLSLVCAGCFSPTGSVPATASSTDASTTAEITTTGPPPGTSTTGSEGSTDATTEPTGPGTTSTPTTSGSTSSSSTGDSDGTTMVETPVCGDGKPQPGELCDNGKGNSDNASCKPDCTPATCGDGKRCIGCVPVEECDDANADASDGCDACRVDGRVLFLSPSKEYGNVTLPKADQVCHQIALDYFAADRQFVAWLSTPDEPIGPRLGDSEIPYRLPGGQKVAENTTELLGGDLQRAIDQGPDGMALVGDDQCSSTSSLVWTGSTQNGVATITHCNGWTSTNGVGWAGFYAASDYEWTIACEVDCATPLRLYCIEKAL